MRVLGVVFVHGVRSSPGMWDSLARLVADDGDLAGVVSEPSPRFGYATGIWPSLWQPLKVIPSISTAADSLKEYLVTEAGQFEDLVLVGHSQGGLVIQRCLVRMLSEGRGKELERVRRVVLLATPNTGSQLMLSMRRALVRGNPQEKELRPFEELVADTARIVLRDIINAPQTTTERSCRIPFSVYAGEQDKVVTRASAQALFPEAAVLPGDHFGIARPTSAEHRTFATVKRLLRQAAQSSSGDRDPPMHSVVTLGPARLEVHSAADVAGVGPDQSSTLQPELTPYLLRSHDAKIRTVLSAVLAGGPSRLVMLTGESSTGKTRALYEALVTVAPGAPVLHPASAQDLLSLLDSGQVRPGCVLWLNEAQRFLYGADGEKAAARLHLALNTSTGIAAVGTLWTEPYWNELTVTAAGNPHGQARALLLHPGFAVRLAVPAQLQGYDMTRWQKLAASSGDSRLRNALFAADDEGRVIQHLSGGPELVEAYLAGPGAFFTHREHALLTAALDARRLGHRGPLSADLLSHAADGGLHARHRSPEPDWAAHDLRALTTGQRADGSRNDVRNTLKALTAVYPASGAEPRYEPADYLDQHTRRSRADQHGTPALWSALIKYTPTPDDQDFLAREAWARGLRTTAVRLWHLAVVGGLPADGLMNLDRVLDPDHAAAEYALAHVELTETSTLSWLFQQLHERGDELGVAMLLARDPAAYADVADPDEVGELLKELWAAGDAAAAGRLTERACSHADATDMARVGALLMTLVDAERHRVSTWSAKRMVADMEAAEPSVLAEFLCALRLAGADHAVASLSRRAAAHADLKDMAGVLYLMWALREIGQEGASTALARRAVRDADLSDMEAVCQLLQELNDSGDLVGIDILLARDLADRIDVGQVHVYPLLLQELRKVGEQDTEWNLLRRIKDDADLTDPYTIAVLISELRRYGDQEGAAALVARCDLAAVETTDPGAIAFLLEELQEAGYQQEMTTQLAERAASGVGLINLRAAVWLLQALWRAGEPQAVARLAERIATDGVLSDPTVVGRALAQLREADMQPAARAIVDAASSAVVTDLGVVASLHKTLWEIGESDAAEKLAKRVAAQGSIANPDSATTLMRQLAESGDDHAARTLAERVAAEGEITNPSTVANVLRALQDIGDHTSREVLLARDPAAHVDLTARRGPVLHVLSGLVRELTTAGDQQGAQKLATRIKDAGHQPQEFAPYGREPDGRPSDPWTWSPATGIRTAASEEADRAGTRS